GIYCGLARKFALSIKGSAPVDVGACGLRPIALCDGKQSEDQEHIMNIYRLLPSGSCPRDPWIKSEEASTATGAAFGSGFPLARECRVEADRIMEAIISVDPWELPHASGHQPYRPNRAWRRRCRPGRAVLRNRARVAEIVPLWRSDVFRSGR